MTSVLFFMEWLMLHCGGNISESSRKSQNMQKTWLLHKLSFFLGRAHIQWYAHIGEAYLDEFFTWVYICVTSTENKKLHLWSLKALNSFRSSPSPREPPSWFPSPGKVWPVLGFHRTHLSVWPLSLKAVCPVCPSTLPWVPASSFQSSFPLCGYITLNPCYLLWSFVYVPVLRRKAAVNTLVHIYWWCEHSGSCLWVNVSTFFLLGKNGIPETFGMCIFGKFCQIAFQQDCISQLCHQEPIGHILNINKGCNLLNCSQKESPCSSKGKGGKTNSKTEIIPREGAGLSFPGSIQVPCFLPTVVREGSSQP